MALFRTKRHVLLVALTLVLLAELDWGHGGCDDFAPRPHSMQAVEVAH
jgi:hypothetical protein